MRLATIGLAAGCSLASVSYSAAKPVETGDLAGRTICWENEETSTFSPDGKYLNSRHGEGVWKVTPEGVDIQAGGFGGVFLVELRDDGTILDATWNVAGKYCK